MKVRTIRVPQFPDVPGLNKFLEEFLQGLNRTTDTKLDRDTANHSLLLQAPDESVWEVKVTNAGALITTKIAG